MAINIEEESEARNNLKEELAKCLKCRYCVDTCPTYQASDNFETEGPMGRIQILRYLLNGKLKLNDWVIYPLYTCLQCRRCNEQCKKIGGGLEVSDIIRLGKGLLSKSLLKEE